MSLPTDLITPEEAAKVFGRSKSRIIQLVYERRVRRYNEGYYLRVSEAEVRWWYDLPAKERMKLIEKTRRRDFTAVEAAGFQPETSEPFDEPTQGIDDPEEWAAVPVVTAPDPAPEAPAPVSHSFFRKLHELRESVEWHRDEGSVAHALAGFDTAVRACLPSILPAFVDPQGYGYFLGFNGWAFEVDRPGRSAEWAKVAKLAWADGLWDRTQKRLYSEPAGMAIQTTLF